MCDSLQIEIDYEEVAGMQTDNVVGWVTVILR
jgi:hypothetical protein